jgi:site-specific DNA-methyltransferase (adenine-specific)
VKPAVIRGDALHLPLPDSCVDAIVTDPPYGLEFMGREWDAPWRSGDVVTDPASVGGFQDGNGGNPYSRSRIRYGREGGASAAFGAWCQQVGAELLRVAKPGAHLAAFGGTRTWHRLVVGLEDAGWEIRDCLMWLYGSGFPKSLDVSKAIDRAAGAEREVVGPGAASCQFIERGDPCPGHRDAGHSQSGATVHTAATAATTAEAAAWDGWGTALKPAWEPIVLARKPLTGTVAANVQAHGVGALNIAACRIVRDPDDVSGWSESGSSESPNRAMSGRNYARDPKPDAAGRWPANLLLDTDTAQLLDQHTGARPSGAVKPYREAHANATSYRMDRDKTYTKDADSGGPSRFYYTAKAGRADRGTGNNHPTVKPVDLMRWLIRLVTPRDGLVLDPFAGSGTTGQAAEVEGRRCVLVERDPGYTQLIQARIDRPTHLTLDLT